MDGKGGGGGGGGGGDDHGLLVLSSSITPRVDNKANNWYARLLIVSGALVEDDGSDTG